ncbi:MAG TPA: hypothetical protein VNA25_09835 [Phycisphaerae bacterium]|nr:hypothetical protein [Phycisphaerae bacterium]
MTVAELTKRLSKLPENMKIRVLVPDEDEIWMAHMDIIPIAESRADLDWLCVFPTRRTDWITAENLLRKAPSLSEYIDCD